MAGIVSLPPDFCKAFAIDGKHIPKHTTRLFSSTIVATYLILMINLNYQSSSFS